MEHSEELYAHGLNLLSELGPVRLGNLKRAFETFENAWAAPVSALASALQSKELAEAVEKKRKTVSLEKEAHELNRMGIAVLLFDDKHYPAPLKTIPVPPSLLYVKGVLPSFASPAISVVGTRKPTGYGRDACSALLRPLIRSGVIITSGLAVGIDTEAHRVCLEEKGVTVAVLGSGIDSSALYPVTNKKLAEDIVLYSGAIISEYAPRMKAQQWTFPQRNRIIAGLSSATLVVEAKEKSGARITASYALEFGRDVLAVPGSIFSENAKTPHALIREGAVPITSAEDIAEVLGISLLTKEKSNALVTPEERSLLSLLSKPASANEIARVLEKNISAVVRLLTLLEMRGMATCISGTTYRRVETAL